MMLHNLGYRITQSGTEEKTLRGSIQHIITGVGLGEGREGCNCMSSLQLQVTHNEFSHHQRQSWKRISSRSSLASSSSPLPMFHHHYLRPLYTDRACYPLQWVYVILIFTIFFDLFLLTFLYILCSEAKERSFFLSFRDCLCYNA
ncbi:hypothetical protein YC2023_107098 [Brassica napus]